MKSTQVHGRDGRDVHYAYFVLEFRIIGGMPVFQGAGIFSEDAEQLTSVGKRPLRMTARSAAGRSYHLARLALLRDIAEDPRLSWWTDPGL